MRARLIRVRVGWFRRLAILVGAVCCSHAFAAGTTGGKSIEQKLEQMTDLIVEMVPVGADMESFMALNDYWPLPTPPKRGDRSIDCLRSYLTTEAYRRFIRVQVASYAEGFPKSVDADLKLLSSDYSGAIRELFLESGSNVIAFNGFDIDGFTRSMSRREAAFVEELLLNDKRFPLRVLLGLGNRLSPLQPAGWRSDADSEELIVGIRTLFMTKNIERCAGLGSEFLAPSSRFSDKRFKLPQITKSGSAGDGQAPAAAPILVFGEKCKSKLDKVPNFGLTRTAIRPPEPHPAVPMKMLPYPKRLLVMGIQGSAQIKLSITERGAVYGTQLVESSGSADIDQLALETPRNWKFLPATIDGIPTCSSATLPVVYKITVDEASRN